MLTLGIETSCDDTGVALVEDGRILANVVSSQYALHEKFGGVVPEIAARAHLGNLPPVLAAALEKSGKALKDVDLVAVTTGPGLLIALLVGYGEARGLALSLGKPWVAVNHLRAHLYAATLADPPAAPPFLALLVSGGHTSLVEVDEAWEPRELGRTRDDAAGECFDKVARALGFKGAGGPAIQRAAEGGDPGAHRFPRGEIKGAPLDFSFSGLKTAALRLLPQARGGRGPGQGVAPPEGPIHPEGLSLADFCAAFQETVARTLLTRVERALADRRGRYRALIAAGGVAANVVLRKGLAELAAAEGLPCTHVPLPLCTDNAAMIAAWGAHRFAAAGPSPDTLGCDPAMGFRLPGAGA